MSVSAVIPTRAGDRPTLRSLLAALASQTHAPRRVIVSIDDESAPAPPVDALERAGVDVVIVRGPNAGPAAARNRAIEHAAPGLVLFLNDDVVPEPTCVEQHVAAHAQADAPSLIVGAAPWSFGTAPLRVIDRLIAETSMVFFYDRMSDGDPQRDWGYRHAWTLNLSCSAALIEPFDHRLRYPMFDDLEWAFRATRRGVGAAVRFCPTARVIHEHRPSYTASSLARRETMIGHQSWALREINGACFRETMRTDDEPAFVARADRAEGADAFAAFAFLSEQPADACDTAALFDRCGSWRHAARAIGWLAAERGEAFEDAAAETLGVFGASSLAA